MEREPTAVQRTHRMHFRIGGVGIDIGVAVAEDEGLTVELYRQNGMIRMIILVMDPD